MFDWRMPAQAKVYTDWADRKGLATKAMPLPATGQAKNEIAATESEITKPRFVART